jgi:tRNA pseudouridine38-40 synthase
MRRKILLRVAYDGTAYCGWQLQQNGTTIEEMLNRALANLFGKEIQVIGASRTDAGVHSRGSVAVFTTSARMPADKMAIALNQRLPADIRVQSSEEVPMAFHPRKLNGVKTYEYRILNRKVEDPLRRLTSAFCYYALDLGKMRAASACLIGEHDFASFCTVNSSAETTVRTIYSLTIDRDAEDMITIRVSGSGFLYNMVRIIAGTLMRIGTGFWPPEKMKDILEARDRRAAGPTAPARGLTMVSLEYEKMPPEQFSGENEHYRYVVDQRGLRAAAERVMDRQECAIFLPAMLPEDAREKIVSRVTIERCREKEELLPLIGRTVHQAYRNGAGCVLVRCGFPVPGIYRAADSSEIARDADSEKIVRGADSAEGFRPDNFPGESEESGLRAGLYRLETPEDPGEAAEGWLFARFVGNPVDTRKSL